MKKNSLFLVGCFVISLSTQASAAPADPSSPDRTEVEALTDKARQLYMEGLGALEKSQWAEAHASFLAAWRIKPQYQIASNLGLSEVKLGKYRDAAEHLTFYMRESPATKVQERLRAKVLLDEALAKVATIKLIAMPAGADVLVNGASVGRTPLADPIFVEPGACVVEARLEGHETIKRPITTTAGSAQDLKLRLEKTKLAKLSVAPNLEGPNSKILIAGGVTAGVAFGAGLVFTFLANGKASSASEKVTSVAAQGGDKACLAQSFGTACEELHGLRQEAATFGNVAVWSFIGAGVVGAGTLVYALAAPRRPKEPSLQAAPLVSATGGGLMLRGSW